MDMRDIKASLALWKKRATDDPDLVAELMELSDAGTDGEELAGRFGSALAFGTGGLRGLLGAGPNRMNIYTVRQATQGLAQDILSSGLPRRAAIAYDSRIKSKLFATEAARVLAANDIEVHIYPRLEPTPALSYAVRTFSCGAGICVTASHNPREYNGYKVYGPDGCQITLESAERISNEIGAVDPFEGVRLADPGDPRIHFIDDDCLSAYLDAVLALSPTGRADGSGLSVVYTPLNGAGRECMEALFARMGVTAYAVVCEQAEPDGSFPTCPYPNPEEKAALALALRLAEETRPDLVIGTDPDCDRMGAAVPDGKGGYTLVTGNEMAALLFDYICRTKCARNAMPVSPVAVTTIVTSDLLTPIAKAYGVELRRTLTGFKFIGEQIGLLEQAGEKERFIFGCEESYGYLSGTHVRDKDAVNASLLLIEMAKDAQARGTSILSDLEALCVRYGYYRNGLSSFSFPDARGMAEMAQKMRTLREQPPKEIAGLDVEAVRDYQDSAKTGLPAADVLEFDLSGGCRLMIRPSGTEPKIKCYLFARGKNRGEAAKALAALEKSAKGLIG